MKQVIIKREHAFMGNGTRMDCYVNKTLVGSVNDNDIIVVPVDSLQFDFKCNMPMNPSSSTIHVDMNGQSSIALVIKQGPLKPSVSVVHDYISVIGSENVPFSSTKIVEDFLAVNEDDGTWAISDKTSIPFKDKAKLSCNDIKRVELIDDGDVITSGGLGGAIVGNLLFGGIGAIVGGIVADRKTAKNCTSLAVKVVLKDAPNLVIPLIEKKTNRDTPLFAKAAETAQAYMEAFQMLIDKQEKPVTPAASPAVSAADELRKFKALMDDGIITEEEFQAKKKQLLGL